jgi:hypothetical protein
LQVEKDEPIGCALMAAYHQKLGQEHAFREQLAHAKRVNQIAMNPTAASILRQLEEQATIGAMSGQINALVAQVVAALQGSNGREAHRGLDELGQFERHLTPDDVLSLRMLRIQAYLVDGNRPKAKAAFLEAQRLVGPGTSFELREQLTKLAPILLA